MASLNDTLVTGKVTQTLPATDDADLLRLGEARTLFNSLFKGNWSNSVTYNVGESVNDSGGFYIANVLNLNKQPSGNPTEWRLAAGAAALTTDVVAEGAVNFYYTAGRFDASFAAKTTTGLAEGDKLYYTQARFDAALAGKNTASLTEGTNLYYTQARFDSAFAAKSTTGLAEGTNLYYTSARFDSAFAAKSTTGLAEGANLYYTQARFDTALAAADTADLAEGTNLYYTATRVRACVLTGLSTGTGGAVAATDTLLVALGRLENRMAVNDAKTVPATTDALTEGATKLYFTNSRADTRSDARIAVQKAAASGLATLDSGSKIPIGQIPSSLIGADRYQGTWNASTNSPTLVSATGTQGYYYIVSVAGSTTLDGVSAWAVGDEALFNGTAWIKKDYTDLVTAVNGATGAVVLTTADIAEVTNLYYTDARARACVLTGFSSATGSTITAADTVLAAFGRVENRLAVNDAKSVSSLVLTGFSSASGGAVVATDSILAAFGRLENRVAINDAKSTGSDRVLKTGDTLTGPLVMTQTIITSGSPALLTLTGAAHTTLAAGAEASDVLLDFNRIVQFAAGALTTQRAVRVTNPKYAFVTASTLSNASTLEIAGAPIAWTNATVTNAAALRIAAGALSGANTNAYSLYVDAPTGGANNYCAVFATGNVGIGTVSPAASALLELSSTTKGLLLPRMTKTQRDAISSPATGLAVFQTDNVPGYRVYNGTNWIKYTEATD